MARKKLPKMKYVGPTLKRGILLPHPENRLVDPTKLSQAELRRLKKMYNVPDIVEIPEKGNQDA